MYKWIKRGAIGAGAVAVLALVLFGTEAVSYVATSFSSVRDKAKDSVPVAFELRRAEDLLDDVIPELHSNVRRIAEEEVEIAELEKDIAEQTERLAAHKRDVRLLTEKLALHRTSYEFGGRTYDRQEVKQDLERRFERLKEAEVALSGKERLLKARQQSLRAAVARLDRARQQKALLEEKIEGLEARHRLIQTASTGTDVNVDQSKLAEADKLIQQIRKRLDVSERVLAHKSKFVESIPLDDPVEEKELIAQIREHLGEQSDTEAVATGEQSEPAQPAPAQ